MDPRNMDDLKDLDLSTIANKPWAVAMHKAITKNLTKAFLNWFEVVNEMGDKQEVINEWASIYMEQFEEVCVDLVRDINGLKRNVVNRIEALLSRLQEICLKLQLEMPSIGNNSEPNLFQEQNELKEKVDELEKLIETREKEIREIQKKHNYLSKCLGRDKIDLSTLVILPSAAELDTLRVQLESWEEEKFRREEIFLTLKSEILKVFALLELEPISDFQKMVVSDDDAKFLVTDENMKLLKDFHAKMKKKQQGMEEEFATKWNTVDSLWNILDVDLLDRENFRQRNGKFHAGSMKELDGEVKRCEKMKIANLKTFIVKYRQDLQEAWQRCHCGADQKELFTFFYADCYTEDLLELYEKEIAKWNRYYAMNEKLLQCINEHQKLWHEMCELETKEANPNRFKNRGGNLLIEEKERGKLSKKIPKLEEKIINLADKYLQDYNHIFTTFDKTVHEYIGDLHQARENDKKLKLSARKQIKEQTFAHTPAKSALSLFPSTSTVNLAATPRNKRKQTPLTPVLGNSNKKSKLLSTPGVSKLTLSVKSDTLVKRAKRLSHERKKRINQARRISSIQSAKRRAQKENIDEYTDFETDLTKRDAGSRSTEVPSVLISSVRKMTPRRPIPKISVRSATPSTSNRATPRPVKLSAKSPCKLIF